MTSTSDQAEMRGRTAQPGRLAATLAGGAFLCLAGGGLLLWWRHGQEVFLHAITSAFAWCF